MCCQFREDLLVSVNIIFWLFLLVDPTSGISWGSNDEIVFGQGAKGIMRVSAKGGKPQNVVTVQNDELADRPQILPGGKTLLFTLAKGTIVNNRRWDAAQIVGNERTHGSDFRRQRRTIRAYRSSRLCARRNITGSSIQFAEAPGDRRSRSNPRRSHAQRE